ncbi:MAG TPA: hypothetical protein VMQ78_03145 [Candidatus Limnocylindria bacterium]|nr:hypothetical protein [Candidatus Limnocylindria bacterium]
MRVLTVERRSDPRLGVAMRVGLALTATGIASAGLGRRALSGSAADVPLAVAFGAFAILLALASLRRPPRASAWIGFALAGGVYLAAALALSEAPLGMAAYVAAAALATWRTPSHLRTFTAAAFALWTPALGLFASGGTTVLPPAVLAAAMFALGYTVAVLVDPSRVHPSDRLRRVGFGIVAIATMAALFDRHLAVGSSGLAPDDVLAIVVAFALPLLAHLPGRAVLRDAIATSLVLTTFTLVGLVCLSVVPYHADAVAAVHRMAEIFLSGRDPYGVFDLPEALARFRMDPELATHLEGRAVLRAYSYPALSFLVVSPFVGLGLGDIRWYYLGAVLVIALVAMSRLRLAWRPMALATIVGSAIVLRQPILAGIDPTWALFVIGAWLALGRAWLSPALLGLAFAARQTAWFVAPFYLAVVWQRCGWREAVRRLLIAGAVALAVNAPFLARSPERFIGGLSAPILGPLEPDGIGFVRLGLAGIGPLFPRVVYGALAIVVFAALLAAFVRWRRGVASAPLVWPFLPLYLAWRSLQNYFVLAPLFVFIADDELAPEVSSAHTGSDREEDRPRYR